AVRDLAGAGSALCAGLEEAELEVSPKTTVIASSRTLAQSAHVALRAKGASVKVANDSADLGIDTAGARRLATAKAQSRAAKASARTSRTSSKLRKHASLAKASKGLWTTGPRPQGIYGRHIMGLAPSQALLQRRQALQAVGGNAPGRCLTTALVVALGDKVPALELARQSAHERLKFRFDHPRHHRRIKQARRRLHSRTADLGKKKWHKVVGPSSAAIAILVAAGWECPAPMEWSRAARPGEPSPQTRITPHLPMPNWEEKRHRVDSLRESAAKHPDGEGFQRGGPDTGNISLEMDKSIRDGHHDLWALDLRAASGGQWTRSRMAETGYEIDNLKTTR
ncbi:unnamed protein product, partial [Prorocentrum cordatum]